jgi:2-oxo-4-hydroxy-4-carboxy-5-ureidoimidazoline decarboxylase
MTPTYSLDALNALSEPAFVAALANVFEHSPWVAQRAAAARPFADVDALHAAMCAALDASSDAAQLALIRAHPELTGRAAVREGWTPESAREQGGAGLTDCSPTEYAELVRLNTVYRERFGFPFILAVRGYDRQGVLAELARRVHNSREDERRESLAQIARIARLRLSDLTGQ